MYLDNERVVYYGALILLEEYSRYPIIKLNMYEVQDYTGKVIEDYSKHPHYNIVIKTENIIRLQVVYEHNE